MPLIKTPARPKGPFIKLAINGEKQVTAGKIVLTIEYGTDNPELISTPIGIFHIDVPPRSSFQTWSPASEPGSLKMLLLQALKTQGFIDIQTYSGFSTIIPHQKKSTLPQLTAQQLLDIVVNEKLPPADTDNIHYFTNLGHFTQWCNAITTAIHQKTSYMAHPQITPPKTSGMTRVTI
jgi:hypothetical protein